MTDKQNSRNTAESGNALFIIFVTVILFAALMYSFTRGARQGGQDLGEKQAKITVSVLLTQSQKMARAVDRLLGHSLSEADISFDNPLASSTNANCTGDKCMVFNKDGGAIGWQPPPDGINDGSTWIFNAHNAVKGVGCDTAAISCTDLVVMLPNVALGACREINDELGITNPGGDPPAESDGAFDETATFDGTFTYAKAIAVTGGYLDGKEAGCFAKSAGHYYFYQVLIGR